VGDHGPLLCVRSTDPERLVAALGERAIVTSSRDSSVRISLHLYNTREDVERILRGLAECRALVA
jgi:selenocysteine lyase/cysteine desulfurase